MRMEIQLKLLALVTGRCMCWTAYWICGAPKQWLQGFEFAICATLVDA